MWPDRGAGRAEGAVRGAGGGMPGLLHGHLGHHHRQRGPAAQREDLGASVSGLQWVVDGYLLMFAALLLSGGVLADRIGARQVFQLGLGLFVLASVGCGLAPTTVVLVIARLVQGVGAALAVPASLALLRAAYPETAARARAIGMWGGIAGVAAAAGPILGGVLVTTASWRLVFFVNIPIGLLALVLIARRVPAPDPRRAGAAAPDGHGCGRVPT